MMKSHVEVMYIKLLMNRFREIKLLEETNYSELEKKLVNKKLIKLVTRMYQYILI